MKNDVISPEFDENGRPLRRIRSFVRRQGRLTKGQQHALDNYWPVMGVEFSEQPLDLTDLFGRDAPVTLEIGFGMGTSLVTMAKARPEQNFLGIEVHSPGVGACLATAHEEGVENLAKAVAARRKSCDGDDAYHGRIARSVAVMEHDEQTGMDPAKAGAFIAKVAMKQRVKPIYTIRFDHQLLALLTRILPYRFLNWLAGALYGR